MNSYLNELASLPICCARNLNDTVLLTLENWTKYHTHTPTPYTHSGSAFQCFGNMVVPASTDPAAPGEPMTLGWAGLSLVLL